MQNIVSASTTLDAWQRLRTSYQTADVVSLIRTRKLFFSHQMSEDEAIEDHVWTMQAYYDCLRDIDTRHATPFDWGMVLASSLPDTWENFVQTIDLDALYDPARTEAVAKSIRSKIPIPLPQRKPLSNRRRSRRSKATKAIAKTPGRHTHMLSHQGSVRLLRLTLGPL